LKLQETYIRILGQLYTPRGTSHFLNKTSDFVRCLVQDKWLKILFGWALEK